MEKMNLFYPYIVILLVVGTMYGTSAASLSMSEKLDTMMDLMEDIHKYSAKAANDVDMKRMRSCDSIKRFQPFATSGLYTIYPGGMEPGLRVRCDMSDLNVGWTIIQLRRDESVDFYKTWQAYKTGFGSVLKNHWLGNDNIHRLTADGNNRLRIDLEDWSGIHRYAEYNNFFVGNEISKYQLTVSGYSGDAGDGMTYHNGMRFSTRDQDNDKHASNCATLYNGGWWYNGCYHANINGRYNTGSSQKTNTNGITWSKWLGDKYSLKAVSMKIRPG